MERPSLSPAQRRSGEPEARGLMTGYTQKEVAPLKKRSLAVGAVVAVLVVAYVAMTAEPPSGTTVTVKTASMVASAYVTPANEEDDDGSDTVVPPFSDFDENGDGAISNAEYAAHLAQLRDLAIARVNASKLSLATKADYVSRLKANFVKESGCATRLANRDRAFAGAVTPERYATFYLMLREYCHVIDPVIPDEYDAVDTQSPAVTQPPDMPTQLPKATMPMPADKTILMPNTTVQTPMATTAVPVQTLTTLMPLPTALPNTTATAPTPAVITEGQAVKCNPSDPAIYRFTNGTIRWYPNPPVAASWDPVWDHPTVIDCSRIPRGADMAMKLPSWIGLPEGQAIKCDPNRPEVYRLTSGQRRWYPNPLIADSWDMNWGRFAVVDCSALPRGDDMALKDVNDGWVKLDGALVQVSFDGNTLCGVNSVDDIWCATNNIRGEGPTQWRQVPGKLTHVDVYGDSLWGVNRQNQIWCGSSHGDPNWVPLSGSLKMITSDNKQVCGVDNNDDIFCADSNIRSSPNWRQVPGKLSYVNLLDGVLVGVNKQGEIFSGRTHGDPKWVQLGAKLGQIAFDGASLCGATSDNEVWCADSGLLGSANWAVVSGKMRQVVVDAGALYGVDQNGGVYFRSL